MNYMYIISYCKACEKVLILPNGGVYFTCNSRLCIYIWELNATDFTYFSVSVSLNYQNKHLIEHRKRFARCNNNVWS